MRIISTLFLIIFLVNPIYSQNLGYHIYYLGSSDINDIYGDVEFEMIKESGGNWTYVNIKTLVPQNHSSLFTNQQITDYIVSSSPSGSISSEYDPNYNNLWGTVSISGSLSSVKVYLDFNGSTHVSLNPFSPSLDPYPVNINDIPLVFRDFLLEGPGIQVNDPDIIALATNLVAGCTTVKDAVDNIAHWISGHIEYLGRKEQDAVTVLNSKKGDCRGFTNLAVALLRASGIPARCISAENLKAYHQLPIWSGTLSFGNQNPTTGRPGHGYCEIYYPILSAWLFYDPQRSINFVTASNIKFGSGHSFEDLLPDITYAYSGVKPTFKFPIRYNSLFSFISNNYIYKDFITFPKSIDSIPVLLDIYSIPPTGIYDEVEITEGTSVFNPGDNVSYRAEFISGFGDTWAVSWDWTMKLYHSEGVFVYHQVQDLPDLGDYSIWNFTTSSNLPDYKWSRDPTGNIYGEVKAISTDNNGEFNEGIYPVSINYKPNAPTFRIDSYINSDDPLNNSISFNANSDGATHYKIYYSSSNTAHQGSSPVTVTGNSFSISNLNYFDDVYITAVNDHGESNPSDIIQVARFTKIPFIYTGSTSDDLSLTTSDYIPYARVIKQNGTLKLDVSSDGHFATAFADFHMDLNNEQNVILEFDWKHYNDEYHYDDGIFFSDDGGNSFVKVFSLDPREYSSGTFYKIKINVDEFAENYDLDLNKTFIVRFSHNDDYKIPTDGFEFTNIIFYNGINTTPVKDALLCLNKKPGYSYVGNTNYGNNPQLFADEWTQSGYRTNKRSLIGLDLSSIPRIAVIESAKLSLYAYNDPTWDMWHMNGIIMNNPGFKSNACYLRRITKPWEENTVTWNNQPSTTNVNQVTLNDSESHDENYINIDITQLVQDMVNYPDESYGLMLILKSETKYTRMALCSSDHPDNSRHPKIEIKYSIPTTSLYFSPSKEAELRLNLCPGYEYVANTNYKSSPYCFADEWTQSGYRTNKKYIFDYDISYLPAGTIIKKADLTFTAYNDPVYDKWHMNRIITNNSGYKSNACWLSEIISYWNDNTVTYNSMPDISAFNRVYLPDAESHDQNYNNIDVTNLIENKYKNPESNYGLMLHLVKEEKYTRMAFHNGAQLKIDFYDKEAFTIPFTVNGSTVNESNDWDVQGPDGNDIAYLFYLPSPTNITATVCNSNTDYDTKLEIFNLNKTSTGYYNDDYPDCSVNYLFSEIEYASLSPGYYYIVVDGYGGNSGNFELNVSEYSYKSSILETSDTTFYESINQVEKDKKQEERFEQSVKIYPNPAQNELNIQLFNVENAELRMFNVTGKLVDAWSIDADQLIINTEKYNNGLYLIWISTEESTFHERVIISK